MLLPGCGSEDRCVREPIVKGRVRPLGDGLRLQGRPPPSGRRLTNVKGSRVCAIQEPRRLRGTLSVSIYLSS